LTIACPESG